MEKIKHHLKQTRLLVDLSWLPPSTHCSPPADAYHQGLAEAGAVQQDHIGTWECFDQFFIKKTNSQKRTKHQPTNRNKKEKHVLS